MASDANSFPETLRYYLRLLWLPLTLLFVFTTIHLLWWLFSMPPTDVLIDQIKTVFSSFGLPALLAISIIEATLVIGGYFPGGLVIVVAVVLANSIPEAFATIAVAITGLFVGHMCNYFLGKYGWHKLLVKLNLAGSLENAKKRLRERGVITAFSTYWLSSVAAILDTAAGVVHIALYRFAAYSLAFTTFWGISFGALFYSVGDRAVRWVTPEGPEFSLAVGVLVLWMAGLVVWDLYKREYVNQ
jgi:membrane protein DedA with SNARE-associated domain